VTESPATGPDQGSAGLHRPRLLIFDGAAGFSCTLESAEAVDARLAEWRALASEAVSKKFTDDGARLEWPRPIDVSRIQDLATAEKDCCSFLGFEIQETPDSVTLEIRAPEDGRAVINSLIGS
jgi:MerR family transcriptional regulator, copper efflux regulator